MYDDMNEIDQILWIELRFGMTKVIGSNPTNEKVESIENELVSLLSRYKEEMKIPSQIPRIRMWITNDKMNFMFFDRKTGKRILLGEWLSNKEPDNGR